MARPKAEPVEETAPEPTPAPVAAEAPKTVRMKIIAASCFISDKSVLEKDGKRYDRRKLMKDEEWDLHVDDAKMLDKLGFAKAVVSW